MYVIVRWNAVYFGVNPQTSERNISPVSSGWKNKQNEELVKPKQR
jgi:hypothetical protein